MTKRAHSRSGTSAQPTPGPWFAFEQTAKNGKSLGWIIEHGNGRVGWSSYATRVPNEGEEAPYPIGAANARLIAAAPELLASVKELVEVYWGEGDGDPTPPHCIQVALAAVDKAEGRS